MILDVSINDSEYILINLYNANTEKDHRDVINNMFALLEKFDTNRKSTSFWWEILVDFFESKLDAKGGNPTIRKKSLAKLLEIMTYVIYGE